jgi:hypothetical protein
MIVAMRSVWLVYDNRNVGLNIVLSSLFSALTVLSHPETALFMIFSAAAFYLFFGFSWKNLWRSLLVAAGVLILASPWLLTVITNHGFDTIVNAGSAGYGQWFEIKNLITWNFGFENAIFLSVFSCLGLLAVLLEPTKKVYLFGLMIPVGYLVFPRSGTNLLTIFLGVLAAVGLSALLRHNQKGRVDIENSTNFSTKLLVSRSNRVLYLITILYVLLAAVSYKYIFDKSELFLSADELMVIEWAKVNTDKNDQFLVYPVQNEYRFWWNDYFSEWFPALTKRESLATVQGYEWIPAEYSRRQENYFNLWACRKSGPECVEKFWTSTDQIPDYIIIIDSDERPNLLYSFIGNDYYEVAFEASSLSVFRCVGCPGKNSN